MCRHRFPTLDTVALGETSLSFVANGVELVFLCNGYGSRLDIGQAEERAVEWVEPEQLR